MRSEEEIRKSIEWLQNQKVNKQIAWSMEIALRYALGEIGLTFPAEIILPDEEEFLKKLDETPEGFTKAWSWMAYGIFKAMKTAGAK